MAHVVSYSHWTIASVPAESWDAAWFALLTWKGYLQSFPGNLATRISARALANGDVYLYTMLVWEYPEQLEEWRESEWSAANLLRKVNPPAYDIHEETFEDFS
jgi:hypothetical protein